jgi:hypothetical protein
MKKEFNTDKFKKLANVLQIIMNVFYWMAIAGMILAVIVVPVILLLTGGDLSVKHLFDMITGIAKINGVNEISGSGSFNISLDTAKGFSIMLPNLTIPATADLTRVFISIVITMFIYCLSLAVLFKEIRDILKTVATNTPFEEMNSKRLLVIGTVLAVSSILFNFMTNIIFVSFLKMLDIKNIDVSGGIDMFMFLTGIFVLILSGVFKYGAYLQKEFDETI